MKTKKPLHFYEVTMTDTFGGEANFSWRIKEKIEASSEMAAITIFKKLNSLGRHRKIYDTGDEVRVDLVGSALCIFCSRLYVCEKCGEEGN